MPPRIRLPLRPPARSFSSTPRAPALPRILQPSTWRIVNPFRPLASRIRQQKSRPWNPATFFICVFLGIGSQAIFSLQLKKGHEERVRNLEVRRDVLREVIERVRGGEEVDVEWELTLRRKKIEEEGWEGLDAVVGLLEEGEREGKVAEDEAAVEDKEEEEEKPQKRYKGWV